MKVFTLLEFAAKMEAVAIDMKDAEQAIVAEIALRIYEEARGAIGTYNYGWIPLAPSTLAHKAADTPLLETGELRDSIAVTIGDKVAYVGSNNDKAVWQELGTSKIPARSFLGGAAMRVSPEVPKIAIHHLAAAFAGRGVAMQGLHELLEAIRMVREAYKPMVDEAKDFMRRDPNGD